jgi:hypothetical protein
MAVINLAGEVFGNLKVLERVANAKDGSAQWLCECSCGKRRIIYGTALRAGRNKSCGCLAFRFTASNLNKHGMSKSRVYHIWQGMINRCSGKSKGKSRDLYFNKGITVCERWKCFENFLYDMGEPEGRQSIDRIDNTKGYSLENCRWATYKQQANNTNRNIFLEVNGVTLTVAQWADQQGIKANTIIYRIRRGWNAERAVSKNPGNLNQIKKQLRAAMCATCKKFFTPRVSQLKNGGGKFCSRQCIKKSTT